MMRKFRFDKLVRDKIPDDQRREGSKVIVRTLDDAEYVEALKQKIIEESQEIDVANRDEAVKELADLQEVLDCLAEALGADKVEIAKVQAAKRDKAGSFKERLYIETIEVADNNPWIKHYTDNPDRYPEIGTGS
jgi:predicted house-cleaning noncanonical NTP pyrophosphatase (MazG superfamily)